MGRNGTSGAWTRVHSWATDKTNAVKITASRFDAEHDDFASGLAASIVEDGQNPFTANQPMGGKNFTGVGDATARSSFAAVSQIADGNLQYLATIAGNTAQNSISAVIGIAYTAYTAGQANWLIPSWNNTGSVTMSVSGLAARSVQAANAAMTSGMLLSGVPAMVISDGSGFHCVNPQRAPANFVPTAGLQDNSVTIAKIKHETTQGAVLSFTASGTPTHIAATTSGYPLVTKGASVDAAFQRLGVGGLKTALFADLTSAAPADGDYIAFGDITDSNNLKRTTRDQMGLQNVVEDTSPQLGASLDVQGFGLTSSSSIMHPSLTSTGKALVLGF